MDELHTRAAEALRRLARNEQAKLRVLQDPALRAMFRRIADRYVAGEDVDTALAAAERANLAGHDATVDYLGEPTRRPAVARQVTQEFVRLAEAIAARGLRCSVSLDLAHLGSRIDRDQCRDHLAHVAQSTADAGIELTLSMEDHEHVDQILDDHAWIAERFDHVGVTVQARLHRTSDDLDDVLDRPGRVRLVKGSYDIPPHLALPRDAPALADRFDALADTLLRSGHPCSIATHDRDRLDHAHRTIVDGGLESQPYVFEFLSGVGTEERKLMRSRGHATQEYIVYGEDWFAYVSNRIAEDPQRVLQAVIDAVGV